MMYGEIARTIAGKLQVKLTAEEAARFARARQVDPEAYTAYLNGMSHWYKLTPPDLDAAQEYFESALKKDPDYALAHLGMGLVGAGREILGLVPPTRDLGPHVLKALELDSNLAEVHFAIATWKTWGKWDWAGGDASFRRAIELNPNYAMARVYYSNLLCYMDRPEEALAQGRRALELDPINPLFMAIYGLSLSYLGRSDEAIIQARAALRTSPDLPPAHSILWAELEEKGDLDAALEEAKAQYAGIDLPQVVEAMSRGYETGGYSGAMRAAAATLITLFPGAHYIDIGGLYLSAGDKEKAIEWLDKAYEIGDGNLPYVGGEDYQNGLLRDDPRYHDLLRRMNLPVRGRK
jgi:tetratricopeptide (TPR) repeat protein